MSQSRVIESAKAVAVYTANMNACTRVLAPTINNMQCQVWAEEGESFVPMWKESGRTHRLLVAVPYGSQHTLIGNREILHAQFSYRRTPLASKPVSTPMSHSRH